MRLTSFVALFISATTLLISCKGEADVSAPTMEVLSFSPAPRAGEICGDTEEAVFFVASGDTLAYEVLFRDDQALSQYKVDIHENFDCHGHARKTEDWSVLQIRDLEGQEQLVSDFLVVPADVTAGVYHFQLQVVDKSGNDNPLANFYSIRVTNQRDTTPPQILVSLPASGGFSITRGQEIQFVGQVVDNYSLGEGGNGKLLLTYARQSGGNISQAQRMDFSEDEQDRKNFNFGYKVPVTLVEDTYEFVLSAYDGVNNESERLRWEVQVTR